MISINRFRPCSFLHKFSFHHCHFKRNQSIEQKWQLRLCVPQDRCCRFRVPYTLQVSCKICRNLFDFWWHNAFVWSRNIWWVYNKYYFDNWFSWFRLMKDFIMEIFYKHSFFTSNVRLSHTRTLWCELFYSLPTKLSRKPLWYLRGNMFRMYKWLRRSKM